MPIQRFPTFKAQVAFAVGGHAAFSNTITSTSLLSSLYTVPDNTLAVGDVFQVHASGTWLNNTGATQTLTINLLVGASNVGALVTSAVAASASAHGFLVVVQYKVIAVGASAVMGGDATLYLDTAGSDLVSETHLNPSLGGIFNSTIANTLDVQAKMSTATATGTVTPSGGTALWLPINASK